MVKFTEMTKILLGWTRFLFFQSWHLKASLNPFLKFSLSPL